MKIIKMPIDELAPAPYNPRVALKPGDSEYEKLKKSIQEFGCVDPIILNERTGCVIGGHQRLQVLKELGYTEIDVSIVDLPIEKEKALNLALNKISGDWDLPKLMEVLNDLVDEPLDIEITGFDMKEIDQLIASTQNNNIVEDNFDPAAAAAEIKEPITKPGDIWQLGRHRLMCGDSTSLTDVGKLMNGKLADMSFTDPPYNVNYTGGTEDHMTIKNDNMPADQFKRFLNDAFSAMLAVTAPGGAIYVCHADSEGANFRGALKDAGWLVKQCIIWVKSQFVIGRQDYQWQHEPILYGWKPGAAHQWYGGRKQSTVIDEGIPVVIHQIGEETIITVTVGVEKVVLKVPSFEIIHTGNDSDTTIWRFDKPLRNGDHPTMKPIGLCARAIQNSSKRDANVADFFGGSGSTLIAAEQTGRVSYIMELDPVYCDVIVQRWEEFTGQKAVRIP